jgi:hypothetical protein
MRTIIQQDLKELPHDAGLVALYHMNQHLVHEQCKKIAREGYMEQDRFWYPVYSLFDCEGNLTNHMTHEQIYELGVYEFFDHIPCIVYVSNGTEPEDVTGEFCRHMLKVLRLKLEDELMEADFNAQEIPQWIFEKAGINPETYEWAINCAVKEKIEEADAWERHKQQERTY